jgi:hypothetical protein
LLLKSWFLIRVMAVGDGRTTALEPAGVKDLLKESIPLRAAGQLRLGTRDVVGGLGKYKGVWA